MRMIAVIALAGFLAALGGAEGRADSTAECGRFFLKYNAETKRMECVGGKRDLSTRTRSPTTIARNLQRNLRTLQRVVNAAESILSSAGGDDLSQEAERRVTTLLTEARQRTRALQRQGRELRQAELQRQQQLASEQRQVVQAQFQLARELEQKQLALTQQLLAEQRARTQELLRPNRGN